MSEQIHRKASKKVLMICYYFPPYSYLGSLRSTKFAKYLGEFGWHSEVLRAYWGRAKEYENNQKVTLHTTLRIDLEEISATLVSIAYSCINFIKKLFIFLKAGSKKTDEKCDLNSTKIVGGLGIATSVNRWFLLPDEQALWIPLALPQALWLAWKCDVIYSSSSPVSAHVLGLILKKLTSKPWVADYRDEWTLNSIWKPPTKFHRWLGEVLDKACVNNADVIINTTETRTTVFINKFGGDKEKFITIHNGYDERDIARFRNVDVCSEHLVMTSIGTLYGGRDPKPFLRAISKGLKEGKIDRQQLRINFIGGLSPDLVKEVERLEIGDVVKISPRIPQQDVFMALARSHVAVLIGSEMEKVAMTTKVYEYAAMGKPILALVPEGPVRDFVQKCGGWFVDGTDEERIRIIIIEIFKQYESGKLSNRPQPEFVKCYERRNLTAQLACCFDGCIKQYSKQK